MCVGGLPANLWTTTCDPPPLSRPPQHTPTTHPPHSKHALTSCRAASATPCAWLPAEEQMTPRASCSCAHVTRKGGGWGAGGAGSSSSVRGALSRPSLSSAHQPTHLRQLRHLVVRPPQLEALHRLQVLTLEQQGRPERLADSSTGVHGGGGGCLAGARPPPPPPRGPPPPPPPLWGGGGGGGSAIHLTSACRRAATVSPPPRHTPLQ